MLSKQDLRLASDAAESAGWTMVQQLSEDGACEFVFYSPAGEEVVLFAKGHSIGALAIDVAQSKCRFDPNDHAVEAYSMREAPHDILTLALDALEIEKMYGKLYVALSRAAPSFQEPSR